MSFKRSKKATNDDLVISNVDNDYMMISNEHNNDDCKIIKKNSIFSSFGNRKSMTTSKSNSKIVSKQSLMTSVVYSFNSSLSAFHNTINRNNMDMAVWKLNDLYFDIKGVWVVAKPIQRMNTNSILSKLEHWAVKIHASPALITIDFFESNNMGGFGVEEVCASQAELKDFLYYFPDKKHDKIAWKILSCVVPTKYYHLFDKHNVPVLLYKEQLCSDPPNHNNSASDDDVNTDNKTDIHHEHNIKKKVKSNASHVIKKVLQHNKDLYELTADIGINKKVCDIGDWLELWVETHPHYSSLEANCQRFAYDLYKFLVGTTYPSKPEQLKKQFQSPWDIISNDNDNNNNNMDSIIKHKKNTKYNNPIPRNKIESFDGDIEIDID